MPSPSTQPNKQQSKAVEKFTPPQQTLPVATKVEWLQTSTLHITLYTLYCLLSLGVLPVVCLFYPVVRVRLRTQGCDPKEHPDMAIVTLNNDTEFAVEVDQFICEQTGEHIASLEANCQRFAASSLDDYELIAVPPVPIGFPRFLRAAADNNLDSGGDGGPNSKRAQERDILHAQYGHNAMILPEVSPCELLIKQALSPFFLFQYFAVTIWLYEGYYLYSVIIFIMTVVSIYLLWSESVFNLERLRDLACRTGSARILMGELVTTVPDTSLVPGDRILVSEGETLPCDCVLISGRVVVDESMLTGESVPVGKTAIELSGLDSNDRGSDVMLTGSLKKVVVDGSEMDIATKRTGSVLSGGTKIKATIGGESIAVVYRTGFRSNKGQLVGMLLNPKEGFVNFFSDALWVILLMLIIVTTLYIYIAFELKAMGATDGQVALHYFDAITVAVPPALTACLSVSTAIAIGRLKHKQIFVSDTHRVNFAGLIRAACFDKTGTLTEENLDFKGACVVSAVADAEVQVKETASEQAEQELRDLWAADDSPPQPLLVQELMATCHNLSLVDEMNLNSSHTNTNPATNAVGDPLEVELFRACGWTLEITPNLQSLMRARPSLRTIAAAAPNLVSSTILRHFEFSSDKLRAGSLVAREFASANTTTTTNAEASSTVSSAFQQLSSAECLYLAKGSPAAIIALCLPASVPKIVPARLLALAKKGLRVIAMCARIVPLTGDSAAAAAGPSTRYTSIVGLSQDVLENTASDASANPNPHPMLFLGLLALSSRLKAATRLTVDTLIAADVSVNMITGDNVHTAISVATDAGILLPFSQTCNRLYIVDEVGREGYEGETVIVDSVTDSVVSLSLEDLLDKAASCQAALFASALSNIAIAADASAASPLAPNDSIQIACTGRGLASVLRSAKPESIHPSDADKEMAGPVVRDGQYRALIRYSRVFAGTKPRDKKIVVDELMATPEFDLRQATVARLQRMRSDRGGAMPYGTVRSGSSGALSLDELEAAAASRGNISSSKGQSSLGTEIIRYSAEEQNEIDNGPYSVLFCGDGANDMSALRAADVGVSLCDAETSVAAPITSKLQSPGSVIEVLLEGRCSLVTAYTLVIYMVLYGIIQLFMALEMYSFGLIAGDYTYLIQDLFFTLILGIGVALTERAEDLHWSLPPKRFLVPWLTVKLGSQALCFIFFQLMSLYMLSQQSWYTRYSSDTPLVDSYSYETSTIAAVCLAQLMVASVTASIGSPFRAAWYTNYYHTVPLVLQTVWVLYQIFQQDDNFAAFFSLKPLPLQFGLELLALIFVNVLASTVLYFVAECFRPGARARMMAEQGRMLELSRECANRRVVLGETATVAGAGAGAGAGVFDTSASSPGSGGDASSPSARRGGHNNTSTSIKAGLTISSVRQDHDEREDVSDSSPLWPKDAVHS